MNSALRRLASTTDEVAGAARRGFSVLPFQLRETLENARRSGKYDEIHLNSVEAAWMDGDMSKRLRPANQGSESGSLILGEDHRTQTRQQYNTNAVNTAAKYKDVPIREGSVTTADQVGLDWYKEGGGWDQELEKLLTFGRSKKTQRTWTLAELEAEAAGGSKYHKDRLDYVNSMFATGPMRQAGDRLEYMPNFTKPQATTAVMEILGDQRYVASFHKSMEFHHKGMKAIESSIYRRARELVRNGDAQVEDLIALNNIGYEMGIPTGSRKSAGYYMHRLSHQVMHQDIMLATSIQPKTAKFSKKTLTKKPQELKSIRGISGSRIWKAAQAAAEEIGVELNRFDIEYIQAYLDLASKQGPIDLQGVIARWQKFRGTKRLYDNYGPDGFSEMDRLAESAKTMNMQELMAFQRQIFEDISQPMQREAELMEDVYGRFTPSEKLDATPSDLIKERRAEIGRRHSMFEHKMAEADRQGGVPPEAFDEDLLELLPAELSE